MSEQVGPIFKDVNSTKALLNSVKINGKEVSEVKVQKIVLRPFVKKIVCILDNAPRVVVYEGEEKYEAHKGDSNDSIMSKMLQVINETYKK
jgi:hypothetical protein